MVKQSHLAIISSLSLLLCSCSRSNTDSNVVSQKYVHKYGFEIAQTEWEDRQKEGRVISKTKDLVTICETYENGVLHGETTYTFPGSTKLERKLVYEKGLLLKEIVYDDQGIPVRESDYEMEDRTINTCWDSQGVPLSIEESTENQILEGKYFDELHNEEASVSSGEGLRITRDRNHIMLHKEEIRGGKPLSRISYYPSGQVQSETFYLNGQPHGIQKKYTETGLPLLEISWNEGVLDGKRTHYKNGKRASEVLFKNGEKEGFEVYFDQAGQPTAEIQWKGGKKHGSARFYSPEDTHIEWYFEDRLVTRNQFESLCMRRDAIADLTGMFSSKETPR